MLRARFDRIFTKTTGYAMLDRQLTRLHRLKPDLLRVLDRPENPASHQWIGKRHPHRRHQAKNLRRNRQRGR